MLPTAEAVLRTHGTAISLIALFSRWSLSSRASGTPTASDCSFTP